MAGVSNTDDKFITGVNNTGIKSLKILSVINHTVDHLRSGVNDTHGKFTSGVNFIINKFIAGFNNTVVNLPPMLLTLVIKS